MPRRGRDGRHRLWRRRNLCSICFVVNCCVAYNALCHTYPHYKHSSHTAVRLVVRMGTTTMKGLRTFYMPCSVTELAIEYNRTQVIPISNIYITILSREEIRSQQAQLSRGQPSFFQVLLLKNSKYIEYDLMWQTYVGKGLRDLNQ